ncbi:Phosphate-selective porin O and P (plasmid) [Planctomyces sp. SH-PL62]|nr:Phosphate-selective porin O and P [Planctomyces sp. SH-PL62]
MSFLSESRFWLASFLSIAVATAVGSPTASSQEAAPPADVLQQFELRLKALEDENRELRDQVKSLVESKSADAESGADDAPTSSSDAAAPTSTSEDPTQGEPSFDVGETESTANTAAPKNKRPLKAWLDKGFELTSEDEEFQLQFHNETQVDYRLFDRTGQGTVHNGFFIPRQIWAFNGRLTKKLEYMASFSRGYAGGIELRDAFVNLKVLDEDRLMFKIGRYRVPYTYEFYALSNTDLISPERSVFALNFSNVREIGAMAWGELFDDRVDYAAGLYNGQRNSFEDRNDEPTFVGFFNVRPFRHSTRFPFLNYLNVGASTDVGNLDDRVAPPALRTSVTASQASGSSTASPAFIDFNESVRENGRRTMGAVHAALFYKRLSLLAEWDRGSTNYLSSPTAAGRVSVPVDAYYVQAGFFLTGEHVTRRAPIKVNRPFNLRRGPDFGIGAIELAARYATLNLGDEVFTRGLADPNLWTNQVGVLDVGFNWYINQYLKVYLDWQRTEFGDPVTFGKGRFFVNSDLFWARLQFLF